MTSPSHASIPATRQAEPDIRVDNDKRTTAPGVNTSRKTHGPNKVVRTLSTLLIVLGSLMALAGVGSYILVGTSLAQEHITVSPDAPMLGGSAVDNPLAAYAQSEAIKGHAAKMADGKTYAELNKEDPRRAQLQTASFLRASLLTSVIAFGVSLLVLGTGAITALIGFALRKTAQA